MRNQACHIRASTRAFQQQVAREPPFLGCGGVHAADKYHRATILQLNVEGLTTSKINVIEQLAHKNRVLVVLLRETHCISADKLVFLHYALAGSTKSRKHSLATFVHESLSWTLVGQSLADAEIEWVCVDVANYNIINVYKPPPSRISPSSLPTFPSPSL